MPLVKPRTASGGRRVRRGTTCILTLTLTSRLYWIKLSLRLVASVRRIFLVMGKKDPKTPVQERRRGSVRALSAPLVRGAMERAHL
jgi:hypothetical protein